MRIRSVFLAALLIPVSLAAGVGPISASQRPAHPLHRAHPAPPRVAPADEYFGHLKMSILGIRNQLRDLDLRLQYDPTKSEDVLGSAAFVEDALHDWEHKYPADPWLAKSVYQLSALYSHCHSDHGQQSAARVFHWLLTRYGRTPYASLARGQMAGTLK